MQQRIRQYKSLLVESYLTPFTPEHGHFPCSCLCFPSTLFRRLVCHGGHLKIICSNSFASALLITRLNISSACRHVPDRLSPTGAMPGTLLSSSTDDRPRKTPPQRYGASLFGGQFYLSGQIFVSAYMYWPPRPTARSVMLPCAPARAPALSRVLSAGSLGCASEPDGPARPPGPLQERHAGGRVASTL